MRGLYRFTKEDVVGFTEKFTALSNASRYLWLHFIRTYPLMWELASPPPHPLVGK